jgi:hypothetical protein
MVLTDGIGQLLHQDGLAGLGGGDNQRSLSLAQRREEVDHSHRQVAGLPFQPYTCVRIAGAQVVEGYPVLRLLRFLEVDLLHFEKREVALTLLRRTHLAHDGVSGTEIEPLDLTGRHIDVVGAVQVVPVLAAQKSVAFRQDFKDALATDDSVRVEQGLLDAEDQVLFSEAGVVGDVQLLSQRVQLSDRLLL